MSKKDYILSLMKLFPDADENNIKVWFKQPKVNDIIRNIKLIKKLGYNKIYYTTVIDKNNMVKKIENDFKVIIYDHNDAIIECLKIKDYNLLKIIEKGLI